MVILAISILISTIIFSVTILLSLKIIVKELNLFAKKAKNYIDQKGIYERNLFGKDIPACEGKPEKKSSDNPEDRNRVATGSAPEDFANLVLKKPSTAVPFGEEIE